MSKKNFTQKIFTPKNFTQKFLPQNFHPKQISPKKFSQTIFHPKKFHPKNFHTKNSPKNFSPENISTQKIITPIFFYNSQIFNWQNFLCLPEMSTVVRQSSSSYILILSDNQKISKESKYTPNRGFKVTNMQLCLFVCQHHY